MKEADVGPVGGRGHSDSKVVNVGDDKRPGDFQVERKDVYDKHKGADRGSLRDPDRDASAKAGGPLKRQAVGAVSEERANPLDQVRADPLSAEESEESGRVYVIIIEAPLHIEEESVDFVAEDVEGLNIVL